MTPQAGWEDGSLFVPKALTVVDSRYRLDQTGGWDIAIVPNGSPDNSVPTADISNDLAELSGQAFVFRLSYTAGSGYTWVLQGNPGGNPGPYELTFTTTDGEINNITATDSFNAIQLRAQASSAGGSMTIQGLSLTINGAAAAVCGSLADMLADNDATPQRVSQWLVADTDLSQVDWTLTGVATGIKTTGSQEAVKFDVTTVNVDPQTITTCGGVTCPVSVLPAWRDHHVAVPGAGSELWR